MIINISTLEVLEKLRTEISTKAELLNTKSKRGASVRFYPQYGQLEDIFQEQIKLLDRIIGLEKKRIAVAEEHFDFEKSSGEIPIVNHLKRPVGRGKRKGESSPS